MRVKVDFTNSDGFPMVEAGLYNAVITKVELAESAAGNKMFVFWSSVLNGPFAGAFLPPIRNMVGMSDDNYYLRVTLEALDPQDPDDPLSRYSGVAEIDTDALVGNVFKMQVAIGEYEGKPQAQVAGVFPIDYDPEEVLPDYEDVPPADEEGVPF